MTTRSVDRLFTRYTRTGDPGALAAVFDSTASELLRVASHFVRDQAEAEDLLQETFLRAIERVETFRRGERVVPWLMAILVNQARMRRRRDARARAPASPRQAHQPESEEPEEVFDGADPLRTAHGRELAERVSAALTGIPEPYREVLQRHLDQEQSGAQIADALGRSPNTVRSQIRRGLQLLRAALPAGFAVACQQSPTRGLADVRDAVVSSAAARGGAAAVTATTWIGGWLLMKKVSLVAGATLLAVAAWWIGTGGLGDDPTPVNAGTSPARVGGVDAETDIVEKSSAADAQREAVPASAPEPQTAAGPDEAYTRALASFVGRVVRADDTPAIDAEVQLFSVDANELISGSADDSDLVAARTRTGSDGRFRLSGFPPRSVFALHASGDGQSRLTVVERSPGPGQEVDLGDVVLPAQTAITGVVTDADGQPIADALVSAIDAPTLFVGMLKLQHLDLERSRVVVRGGRGAAADRVMEPPPWVRKTLTTIAFATARTGPDGRFEISGVQPGINTVTVSAPGMLMAMKSGFRARAGQTKDLRQIRLREGEEAVVQVLDAAGAAVPDAEVLVGPRNATQPMDFVLPAPPTDAQGRTVLAGLPSGRVTVAARRGPGNAWVLGRGDDVAADLDVRLPAVCKLTLGVRAAAGSPVSGANVRLARGTDTGLSAVHETLGLAAWLARGDIRSDDRGRVVIEDLDAGAYVVEVSAGGFVQQRIQVALQADTIENVTMERAIVGEVTVLDPRGAPVRFAEVVVGKTARVVGGFGAMGIGAEAPGTGRWRGRTDAEGRCSVEGIGAGPVRITARHPAFGIGEAQATWPQTSMTVTLPDHGHIAGKVVGHDASPEAALPRVVVAPVDPDALEMPRLVIADREGLFTVRGLTPGGYTVRTSPSLEKVRSVGSALSSVIMVAGEGDAPERYEVRSGAVTEVVLGADDGVAPRVAATSGVRGTAWIDGVPAVGCRVMAMHRGVSSVMVSKDGSFEFDKLHGTKASLVLTEGATTGPGARVHWRGNLQLGQALPELRIEVATGALSGRVVDAAGQPVSGVLVMAVGQFESTPGQGVEQPSYRSAYQCESGADGAFSFAKISAGKYELNASRGKEVKGEAKDIVVAAGGVRAGVTVTVK